MNANKMKILVSILFLVVSFSHYCQTQEEELGDPEYEGTSVLGEKYVSDYVDEEYEEYLVGSGSKGGQENEEKGEEAGGDDVPFNEFQGPRIEEPEHEIGPSTRSPTECTYKGPSDYVTKRDIDFIQTINDYSGNSRELCLDDNGVPINKVCDRNGQWKTQNIDYPWEDLTRNCSNKEINNSTKVLYTIFEHRSFINITLGLEAVNNISKNSSEFTAADIYLITKILVRLYSYGAAYENTKLYVNTVSNLMAARQEELFLAQKFRNATDMLLYVLDQVLIDVGNINLTEEKLLVRTVNMSNELRGVMIKTQGENHNFGSFETEFLYNDNYEQRLLEDHFEIAFLVPRDPQERYIITLFHDDSFFKQENSSETIGSWIISVLVPNRTKVSTPATIKIYYKEFHEDRSKQQCQYWKYRTEDNVPIKGKWSFDANATKFKDHFYICEFNHTTHFGMLVSETATNSTILDVITIFGSALSLMGIAMIFIMAFTFKHWRTKANSKIIINVSICLLLLIILFFISGKIRKGLGCIITGMMLHYIVLAKFCWALTVSYSSYRRFYMISHDHIENVLLKFCTFSWGLPLIIVTIVAAIDVQTYDKTDENSTQMCYPKDIYLQLGVCLPMGIILFVNSILYILIIKKTTTNDYNLRKHVAKKTRAVQKSMILLFFMMGITWIFGFLVVFTDQTIFLYAFCTTATLHGFVIFVFYVLDSPEVKTHVKKQIQKLRTRKGEKTDEASEEVQTTSLFQSKR